MRAVDGSVPQRLDPGGWHREREGAHLATSVKTASNVEQFRCTYLDKLGRPGTESLIQKKPCHTDNMLPYVKSCSPKSYIAHLKPKGANYCYICP